MCHVLLELFRLLPIPRRLVHLRSGSEHQLLLDPEEIKATLLRGSLQTHLVQGKPGITRNREIQIEGQIHNILPGVAGTSIGLDLLQAIAHKPDAIDEKPVRRTLDLKVAKESICAEDGEDFIEDIVALAVDVGDFMGGQRLGRKGERIGGAARLRP